MEDVQNRFYSSISKYYSDIFPYNPMQLEYVKNKVGNLNGKHILDIGCATGELAYCLAKSEAVVSGIDLNDDLLAQAQANKVHPKLSFQQGDMLDVAADFSAEQFDAVLCFGNTLVHLQNETQVQQMLEATKKVLKPGGQFLLQILNYDYIVGEHISALPLIDTENIRFIRSYLFFENSPLVKFHTDLEIKAEQKIVTNDTDLLALKSAQILRLLEKAGYKNVQLFANFKQAAFGGKHIPLVLSCEKN